VALLGLASDAAARGTDVAGLLIELGETYGHFASGQVSVRVDDLGVISRTMAALRTAVPTTIGSVVVESAEDLLTGADGAVAGDVLRYRLAGGARVIVRPSGTEPKLKIYIDASGATAEEAAATVTELEEGVRALLNG